MNRGMFQNGLVQQILMDGSNTKWWSLSNTRPSLDQVFSLMPQHPTSLLSSTDGTHVYPQYQSQQSGIVPVTSLPGSQDIPADSWSQLLGGTVGEGDKYELSPLQPKKTDNCEDEQVMSAQLDANHVKQGHNSESVGYFHGHGSEEDGFLTSTSPWRQIMPAAASSARSCITTSFSSSMLDFSNSKRENKRHQADNSSECNSTSTGEALKKPRVQVSSSAQSAFKVRKEKLGERITALHQLVSPFGKTDTASVLLEAIGYIRFLQSQIEALSSPYMDCGSGNRRQPNKQTETRNNDEQPKKDLRSRGLCLVPVSFTLHVGNDTGADFWAAAFTAGSGGATSSGFR